MAATATAATPIHLAESTRIQEGSILPQTREIVVTVIRKGFGNKAGNRYYPSELLQKSAQMFENARMYADHLTEKQEKELSGMPRSVRDLVGRITEAWYDAQSDSVKAKVKICRDWFWEIVTNDIKAVEVSIDALGTARNGTAEGRSARVVESFHRVRSVDFVTHAGAGGSIDAILEAQQEDQLMLETISLDDLAKHRPDLIDAIKAQESGAPGGDSGKTDNDNQQPAVVDPTVIQAAIKEAVAEAVAEATEDIKADADKRVAVVEARAEVKKLIDSAKLPEASANQIYEGFHDNCLFDADGDKDSMTVLREKVQEAIKNKKDEIKQWLPKGGVTGMGPSATMLESDDNGNPAPVATPLHDHLIGSIDLGPSAEGGE